MTRALLQLEAEGQLFRGNFSGPDEWCNRRILARIHRVTLGRLRREIEPVSAAESSGLNEPSKHAAFSHASSLSNGVPQRIAHFLANDKEHRLFLSVGMLSAYFGKLAIVHASGGMGQNDLAAALKVPPFFVRDYASAARNYPPQRIREVQHLLRSADLRSKGVGNASADDGELLRELLARVMN